LWDRKPPGACISQIKISPQPGLLTLSITRALQQYLSPTTDRTSSSTAVLDVQLRPTQGENDVYHTPGSETDSLRPTNDDLSWTLGVGGRTGGSRSCRGGRIHVQEKAFWTKNGNAATAQLFAGKWIYAPITNSLFSSFRSFLSPSTFVHSFFGTVQGPFTKGKTAEVDGASTIGVMSDGPGTLYAATSGTHFIEKVQGSKSGSSAVLTFSSYNKAVHPVKPAGGVSLKSLENG
jgi:hypothetical protein